jgi:hypothetical protein
MAARLPIGENSPLRALTLGGVLSAMPVFASYQLTYYPLLMRLTQ